jgi:hypothetical protein
VPNPSTIAAEEAARDAIHFLHQGNLYHARRIVEGLVADTLYQTFLTAPEATTTAEKHRVLAAAVDAAIAALRQVRERLG